MTNTKELPKNIETWVNALESGEYAQCTKALHNGDGYCCLGVYAKVVLGHSDEHITVYEEIRSEVNMDISVYRKGISMNDNGKSFLDIAKMIREAYT